MNLVTDFVHKKTKGQGDFIDITSEVQDCIDRSQVKEGQVTVFVVGSTAGITTFEFEPGLKKDLNEVFENLAPRGKDYAHHQTWGDDNGSSHIRAALQGCSVSVPFVKQKLLLGTWQQIVLAEFDTRARDRKVVVQLIGV